MNESEKSRVFCVSRVTAGLQNFSEPRTNKERSRDMSGWMYATCNRVNMEALIVALEAGKYPQAQQYLKTVQDDGTVVGYCCAGVAGVLAEEAGAGAYDLHGMFTDADQSDLDEYQQDQDQSGYYVTQNQVMTRGIITWLGLYGGDPCNEQNLPAGEYSDGWGTTLNDGGQSFTEIAAALRDWYGIPKAAPDA